MGSSETEKPAKESKTLPSNNAQEPSSSSPSTGTAEWTGFQAYSPIAPPGFLASSPQAHPYMWGVQPIMPPYGTPAHPYVAMYPHGGLYAHPSIPPGTYPFSPFAMPSVNGTTEASGNAPGGADADSKPPEGKEKLPVKRSKGSLGSLNLISGKSNEEGKTAGTSADGASSKSTESAGDGTSEGSGEISQNASPMNSGERREAPEAVVTQNGTSAPLNGVLSAPHTIMNHAMTIMPMAVTGAPAPAPAPGPTTNLNIGMDYWGAPASSTIPAMRGQVSASVASGMASAGSRDNLQSPMLMQDERECKRQRRKQSNRESARRSRLRKQAECDELTQHAESMKDENANLRSELNRIRGEYEQLMAENTQLKERLGEAPKDLGSSQSEQRGGPGTQHGEKGDQVHSSL